MKMELFKDNHPFWQFREAELEGSRVSRESPSIFVCGGLVDIRTIETNSVREHFFASMGRMGCPDLHDYCITAETFKDYHENGKYRDLSEFESDLAHFASLLIIFLESPGAIVELGLFCNVPGLREKLLVFVNETHYESDSFIKLGPLTSLTQSNDKSVLVYPWELTNPGAMSEDVLQFVFSDINEAISEIPKSELFSKTNPGHLAFLIYECIRLFRALRLNEIQKLLSLHEIQLNDRRLKNLIYLLTIAQLVERKTIGRDTFYLALRDERKINFLSKIRGKSFDFEGIRIEASVYYTENDGERRRAHIIEAAHPKREVENVPD